MDSETGECEAFGDDAGAFVLGDLTGPDRGAFVAHLASCARCQSEVATLTETLDVLSGLVAPLPPSAGFVDRVLAGLPDQPATAWRRSDPDGAKPPAPPLLPADRRSTAGSRRPRRHRRRVLLAVGGAVVLVIVLGWFGSHSALHRRVTAATPGARTPVAVAALRTGDGAGVGQVVVFDQPRTWVAVSLDLPASRRSAANGPYTIIVVHRNGRDVPLGRVSLLDGRGAMGALAGVAADEIADVRVETPAGVNLCAGFLSQPPPGAAVRR